MGVSIPLHPSTPSNILNEGEFKGCLLTFEYVGYGGVGLIYRNVENRKGWQNPVHVTAYMLIISYILVVLYLHCKKRKVG